MKDLNDDELFSSFTAYLNAGLGMTSLIYYGEIERRFKLNKDRAVDLEHRLEEARGLNVVLGIISVAALFMFLVVVLTK